MPGRGEQARVRLEIGRGQGVTTNDFRRAQPCEPVLSGLAEKVISADQAQYEIVASATEHVVADGTTHQRVSVRTAVETILTRPSVESVLHDAPQHNSLAFIKTTRATRQHPR